LEARELPKVLISPNCVFDASLVPETGVDSFVDFKGLTQQVSGEFGLPEKWRLVPTWTISVYQMEGLGHEFLV
jgi:hypothetical protein